MCIISAVMCGVIQGCADGGTEEEQTEDVKIETGCSEVVQRRFWVEWLA